MTYLQFELLNSLCHSENFFFEGCLLSFEVAQLLLEALTFCILITIVPIYLLCYAMELIRQGFPGILALHGEY